MRRQGSRVMSSGSIGPDMSSTRKAMRVEFLIGEADCRGGTAAVGPLELKRPDHDGRDQLKPAFGVSRGCGTLEVWDHHRVAQLRT